MLQNDKERNVLQVMNSSIQSSSCFSGVVTFLARVSAPIVKGKNWKSVSNIVSPVIIVNGAVIQHSHVFCLLTVDG